MRRLGALLLMLCLCAACLVQPVGAAHREIGIEEVHEAIEGLLARRKADSGLSAGAPVLSGAVLESAATAGGDWVALSVGRLGLDDDAGAYLALMKDAVQRRYAESGGLDEQKATEWHRVILTVLALGGDPTDMGTDEAGETIDLVADGVYDRGLVAPLDAQGTNGWIFGLLALDAYRYDVPEGAYYSRDDLVAGLLAQQLEDGGFALGGTGGPSDIDLTGMALQALAPYYNSEQVYNVGGAPKTVRQAADAALALLQEKQGEAGDFGGNLESTAQVMVALCALGIDPVNDARFIKGGSTVLDGLMQYQSQDGGFAHQAGTEGQSGMASEQALYALTAYCRFAAGLRSLYDCRPEMAPEVREAIDALEGRIAAETEGGDAETLAGLLEAYKAVPAQERSYVRNYALLADALAAAGLANDSEPLSAAMEQNTSGKGAVTDVLGGSAGAVTSRINESDLAQYEALPEVLTGEHYAFITALLDKVKTAENGAEHADLVPALEEKKAQVDAIRREVEAINQDVMLTLYPLEDIGPEDKAAVADILARTEALSEYDRAQVLGYEDLERAGAGLATGSRTVVLAVVLVVVAAGAAGLVLWRMNKRKKAKRAAGGYAPDDDEDDETP